MANRLLMQGTSPSILQCCKDVGIRASGQIFTEASARKLPPTHNAISGPSTNQSESNDRYPWTETLGYCFCSPEDLGFCSCRFPRQLFHILDNTRDKSGLRHLATSPCGFPFFSHFFLQLLASWPETGPLFDIQSDIYGQGQTAKSGKHKGSNLSGFTCLAERLCSFTGRAVRVESEKWFNRRFQHFSHNALCWTVAETQIS